MEFRRLEKSTQSIKSQSFEYQDIFRTFEEFRAKWRSFIWDYLQIWNL